RGDAAPGEWDQYREAARAGLQAADLVVAPSVAMLESLCEHYGPLPNATAIPNGRGWPAAGTDDKKKFVFAAGRVWDEAKNIGALDAVAPDLAWPVYIAGDRGESGKESGDRSQLREQQSPVYLGRI